MDSVLALPGWHDIKEVLLHHLDAEARREAVLICKEFHKTISYLQNKSLEIDERLIDSMKDQKVVDSIMSSSRRFSEIKVDAHWIKEATAAERTVAVVEKFKRHTKKLTLTHLGRPCSPLALTALLNAATDVEVLSLNIWPGLILTKKFDLEKEFTKLKDLCITGLHEITGILSKIPDHSLERLTIIGDKLSEDLLQAFINRQAKLKKLSVNLENRNINVDHLVLEELHLCDNKEDKEFAALLKHQPLLRRLHCETIGSAAFNELRKMRNLEALRADISDKCAGELANLKELVLHGDCSNLHRVVLPKLEKFVKRHMDNSMATENFMALSRSSQNLQHIVILNRNINFVPAIIEQFPKLKTLFANSFPCESEEHGPNEEILVDPAPSRQNLSLEEIVVNNNSTIPIGSLYAAINACPNLKRISLGNLRCTAVQVLGLILSHQQLTHFEFEYREPGGLFQRSSDDVDSLHPELLAIIRIFRDSADFKHLSFYRIPDWVTQPIEDLLNDDADKIIVKKYAYDGDRSNLELKKKSNIHDPFKSFHEFHY